MNTDAPAAVSGVLLYIIVIAIVVGVVCVKTNGTVESNPMTM